MKNIALLFSLFFIFTSSVFAYTLKGNVSYTVDTIRDKAFKNVNTTIDIYNYADHLIDINQYSNYKKITRFSDGGYSINYKNRPQVSYVYYKNGKLEGIILHINKKYPKKSVAYDVQGDLSSIMYTLKNKEQFIFDKNKKLVAHWIGKNCYNEQGELIMTRE